MYAAYNGYPQVVKLLLGRQTCHVTSCRPVIGVSIMLRNTSN